MRRIVLSILVALSVILAIVAWLNAYRLVMGGLTPGKPPIPGPNPSPGPIPAPKPRPTPVDPLVDVEQDRLNEIYLASVPAQFRVPFVLDYGSSKPISFVLEPQGPGSGASRLEGAPGDTSAVSVLVSRDVKALLKSNDLVEIRLRTPERRPVTRSEPVPWVWDVKAIGEGIAHLELQLVSFVPRQERELRHVTVFKKEIDIEISMLRLAQKWTTELTPPLTLLMAVLSAFFGALAYYIGWKRTIASRWNW